MALTDEQVRRFREDGVLAAEGVIPDAELAPVISAYQEWIDRKARRLLADGKIAEPAAGEPFERRFAQLYAQCPEVAEGMDIMQARLPALFAFLRCGPLLDAVESLIGPEIICNPIQHIRAKPPATQSGTEASFYNVPWHQDAMATWAEADHSDIITCWIPLVDASVDNGCMEVMPGVWRRGYLEHHRPERETEIRPNLLPENLARAVPIRRGGVVFMNRYTPHRSTPNYSDRVRWSLDLRYQPAGTATGRPFHPSFPVRSRAHPEQEATDFAEWDRQWAEALAQPAPESHRVG